MPILTNLLLLCDILSKENKIILFLLFIFIRMGDNPILLTKMTSFWTTINFLNKNLKLLKMKVFIGLLDLLIECKICFPRH